MCTGLLGACFLGFVLGLVCFLGFVWLLLWLWMGFFNMVVVRKEVVDCVPLVVDVKVKVTVSGVWVGFWESLL